VIIDGNSGPITSVTVQGDATTLTWASVNGGVYEVLYKDNLASSNWSVLSTGITATGSSTSWWILGRSRNGFIGSRKSGEPGPATYLNNSAKNCFHRFPRTLIRPLVVSSPFGVYFPPSNTVKRMDRSAIGNQLPIHSPLSHLLFEASTSLSGTNGSSAPCKANTLL